MYPEFRQYLGENDKAFPSTFFHDLPVSFRAHLDKPPSEELWKVLTSTLHIRKLYVLLPHQHKAYRTLAPCTVVLYLDEQEHVKDILFEPWYQ